MPKSNGLHPLRRILPRALVCALVCACTLCLCPSLTYAEAEYVEGEVVVVCEDTAVLDQVQETETTQTTDELETVETSEVTSFEVKESLPTTEDNTETVVAEVPEGMSVEEAVSTLENVDGVVSAQPNYLYPLGEERGIEDDEDPGEATLFDALATITDPYYTKGRQVNLTLHDLLSAWDVVKTQGTVAIAVLDTGCRLDHEDLKANVSSCAWDFSNSNNQSLATSVSNGSMGYGGDEDGHGTHVCGVIAAEVNNAKGIAGSSYNATLVPIAIFNDYTSHGKTYKACSTSTLVSALDKVLELHDGGMTELKIVNMSVGATGTDTAVSKATAALTDAGILCVAAAGNESTTSAYIPADCTGVLSVMALDKSGNHTSYTNYKTGSGINTSETVSAMGGGGSSTTDSVTSTYYSTTSSYTSMSGTSQAAPLVSGVAALVWAVNPSLSVAEVKDILTSTADPVSSSNDYTYKDAASAGSVDAYEAVCEARERALTQVDAPTAATGLTYTGSALTGVSEGTGYTLSGTPVATNAGTYTVTASLSDTSVYVWSDGTSADKTITWTISPVTLTATYPSATIFTGESVPTALEVTGFVNGETTETAAGYTSPSVSITGVDANTPGTYTLTPASGSATNYTFTYVAGTLEVLGKVDVPSAQTGLVYTGTTQAGVASGTGYVLTGDYEATNVGTYTATVSPAEHYRWADGSTAAASISWSIAKATLTATYDGGLVGKGQDPLATVSVDGFVNGETASTAAGYVAPTVDVSGVSTSSAGTYTLTPTGGSANNYDFTYQAGTLTVSHLVLIAEPTAATGLVYNGSKQLGIAAGTGYTLSGTTSATDAGSYTATATLEDGYGWSDGNTETKSYDWTIAQAPLTATYAGGTIYAGATAPTTVTVTGFVGDETASTAAGYTAPTVTISSSQRTTPGGYSIKPSGGSATNYTFTYVAGTLAVYGKATAPTGKTLTYNRTKQTGVVAGTGYTLSGTTAATAASTYAATAKLNSYYKWTDGSTAAKTISWRINAANISGATISAVGTQAYTGSVVTPTPTVTLSSITLTKNTDYVFSYKNNVNAGTATLTITGKGNYAGTKSTTFKIVAPSVTYRTHVQSVGWQSWRSDGAMAGTSGRSLRLEAINLKLAAQPASGSIQYRTHVQNVGWQDWVADGAMAGTSGRSLRLEAIQVRLTGSMAELYDVYYRVHAQNIGWMGWAKNGASAGTAHHSYRLEAMQVVILPKGSSAPSTTYKGVTQNQSFAYKG